MDMDPKELNLNKGPEGCGGGGGGEGFIDRSKVRILLCDNDESSSEEVLRLLLKCSYQVTSVKSPRQVIDALNAEGPDIDIILAEVDLPMRKGTRMLKYITRHRELRRIPVIIFLLWLVMSAQDEVSTVVKCLRLGAADYLVKPLRTNELLNLWTHMWRRRHMLGLAEKNVFSYDFDTVVSDPSDPTTNSFSDDTEEKSQKSANPEIPVSAATEPPLDDQLEFQSDVPEISDRQTGKFSSGPKKSELKIGGSSAFFTYVKSSTIENNSQVHTKDNGAERSRVEGKHPACSQQMVDESLQVDGNGEAWESYSQEDDFPTSNSIPDSLSLERSCTPPGSMELQHRKNHAEDRSSQVPAHPRNEPQHDVSRLPAHASYPYYMPRVVNQVMGSSSTQVYQKNLHDMPNHAAAAIMQHYSHLPHCPPHVNGMTSFSYYPLSICLQPGQMPNNHSWPSLGSSSASEVKLSKVDRREAALIKFRQKRKERCFDKKIRYVNRKRLAERRPRVRGQFVRKVNGVDVDLNGQPASLDDDEDDEDEKDDEELA
ncbi:two-component response regulator-like APRR1 isoform X1 [Rosa chinensis]|uniref:two-component response regulator-like APRR1 isoform X1 n=1 Tax=Rosa chinensis TaxID=74649 RepID=UPI001AD92474|nr:two-component response regulator-like APRR1 isoform X1 [Rosa chinensis]